MLAPETECIVNNHANPLNPSNLGSDNISASQAPLR